MHGYDVFDSVNKLLFYLEKKLPFFNLPFVRMYDVTSLCVCSVFSDLGFIC